MKAAVVVDWQNLKALLRGKAPSDLPAQIVAFTQELALASNSIDAHHLYSRPIDLGPDAEQLIWSQAGFEIHSQPGTSSSVKDQIVADSLAMVIDHDFKKIFLICGTSDYDVLKRELRRRGCQLDIVDSESRLVADVLSKINSERSSMRADSISIVSNDLTGVVRMIRESVVARTQRQLSPKARKLGSKKSAEKSFQKLIENFYAEQFVPDLIVAWTDNTRHWNGSLEVANRLKLEFQCEICEIGIREEGEKRHLTVLPDSIGTSKVALIVDDAAFTGGTFKLLKSACQAANPSGIFKTAVLSALDPVCTEVDFHADRHQGTDVLFPWGWARSVDQFYDLLKELGTRDRRWLPREHVDGLDLSEITDQELCSVVLIENNSALRDRASASYAVAERLSDDAVYVLRGEIFITVEGVSERFLPGEFLFIPRVVSYSLELAGGASILKTAFRNVSELV